MSISKTFASLVACASMSITAAAQLPSFTPPSVGDTASDDDLVTVRVAADVETIHAGERFSLAVIFNIRPGWHIYWSNPGSAGLPTQVEAGAPDGFEVGTARFTRPLRFEEPEGVTFGYEERAVIFLPVTAPQSLTDGTAQFDLELRWLVCRGRCVLGSDQQSITVPTSSVAADEKAQARGGETASIIAEHRARLPRPIEELAGATVRFDGSRLTITGPAEGRESVSFFPIEVPGVTYSAAEISVSDDRFTVHVPVALNRGNALGGTMVLEGLVALGSKLSEPSYHFDLTPGPGEPTGSRGGSRDGAAHSPAPY